jgi:excinuclease ABC subunit C
MEKPIKEVINLFDIERLKSFPKEPGVYLMKDVHGNILYIGKAKNLKSRVRCYFNEGSDTREMIPHLIAQVVTIDTIVTFSEKEALILENNLIKHHQPKYNALLKDDKTFISLMINIAHPYPMLKLVRFKGKMPSDGLYFGPYPSAFSARKTLEVLQKVFPLRQCSDHELTHRKKPCLLYGIKRCIAPCVQKCTPQDYSLLVTQVTQFLKGKNSQILDDLESKIELASKNLEYEKAESLYQTLKQVKAIFEHQEFVVQMKVDDCDVIGFSEKGPRACIVLMEIREGKLINSTHHYIPVNLTDTTELLSNFILQYYQDAASPELILTSTQVEDASLLEEILVETHKKKVTIACPLKGNKRQLIEMAIKNSSQILEQQALLTDDGEKLMTSLQEALSLDRMPMKIECFDTSNIALSHPVAAMVTAIEGKFDKSKSRLYKVTKEKSDDYTALKEVLKRRYERAKLEDDLPDLIIIDGGKGQLNLADTVLKDLGIASCDLIALCKEEGRHDKGLSDERVFTLNSPSAITFDKRSPVLFFLQKIRDESHRMAIQYNRKLRSKETLKSGLDTIAGIGPTKKKNLLKTFGSLKGIESATEEALKAVKGITKKDIETLKAYFEKAK